MNAPLPSRAALERFGRLLAEYKRRQAKAHQSRRGWYDENGVRQGGLIAFVRYFWHVLEPATKLVDGWPLWAMCEHLEAVTFGEVTRLLINVPPGFMKSLLVDVFWPAWEWGPVGRTHYRYIAFSYSASLTERDNDRFRTLLTHPSYQRLWGPLGTKVQFGESDEIVNGVALRNKTTLKVMNTKTGWKLASSVGGVGTGERGDRVIIDDPHNVIQGESETIRGETVRWFRESISSRFNDLETGALIVIMQRIHEDDVSGTVLSEAFNYCHLMIPWELETARALDDEGNAVATDIGWTDPRLDVGDPDSCEGLPAWSDRFSDAAMDRTRAEVGPYAWAAQYQQAPAPRGGGIFQRDWWQLYESDDGKFPVLEYVIASLDGAFTEKEENDPSGLTVWGIFQHKSEDQMEMVSASGNTAYLNRKTSRRIILVHAWRKHLKFSGPRVERLPSELVTNGMSPDMIKRRNEAYRRRTMKGWGLIEWTADTCRRFKVDKLLIEGKASGISAAHELQNRYPNEQWSTQLCAVKGDKVARALAVQPTFSQLMVYAPDREWSELVIDEMAVFPKGKHDDLTDSATQAMKYLRDVGMAQTNDEVTEAEYDNVRHKPKVKALYPV